MVLSYDDLLLKHVHKHISSNPTVSFHDAIDIMRPEVDSEYLSMVPT
jgi:hypothetical protein